MTNAETRLWGKEWVVGFDYNPWDDNKHFRLIFKECTSVHWDAYADEDERDAEADVIGIHVGEDEPATIHTDLFEISVAYGELVIEKDW